MDKRDGLRSKMFILNHIRNNLNYMNYEYDANYYYIPIEDKKGRQLREEIIKLVNDLYDHFNQQGEFKNKTKLASSVIEGVNK